MNPPGKTVVSVLDNYVTTFSRPFKRLSLFHIGARSTAVTLSDNTLMLFSPTLYDNVTEAKLKTMPTVAYLVALDQEHYLNINRYKEIYPNAKVIAPESLSSKNVPIDIAFTEQDREKSFGPQGEIKAVYFHGFQNKDIAFLHIPTKTLIQADLMFNLPATEQYSQAEAPHVSQSFPTSFFAWMLQPGHNAHRRFLWYGSKTADMKRDAKVVSGWDFERIIPCHGDVIQRDGKKLWDAAYSWYL